MIVATHLGNLLNRADPRAIVGLKRTAAGINVASQALSDGDARRLALHQPENGRPKRSLPTVVLVEGIVPIASC